MTLGVVWSPILPAWALIAAAIAVLLVSGLLLVSRTRGSWWLIGAK